MNSLDKITQQLRAEHLLGCVVDHELHDAVAAFFSARYRLRSASESSHTNNPVLDFALASVSPTADSFGLVSNTPGTAS
jgi:hypothetical protein